MKILKDASMLEAVGKLRLSAMALILIMAAFGSNLVASDLEKVDASFNAVISTSTYQAKEITTIVPLTDGKILVSGNFNSYNRIPTGILVRLNSDSSLDPTFNNNLIRSTTGNFVFSIVPLQSGKILIGGSFKLNGEAATRSLIRLNADGTIDPSFNFEATSDSVIGSILMLPNGRIIISGRIKLASSSNILRVITRLNADGSVDQTFNFTLIEGQLLGSIALQGDKVIFATQVTSSSPGIYRLNADGSLDASFTRSQTSANQIVVQSDGRIVATTSQTLFRLNADGTSDASFQIVTCPILRKIGLAGADKLIVACGSGPSPGFTVERRMANGAPDPSFAKYIYNAGLLYSLAVDANEQVLLGDNQPGFNATAAVNKFERLNSNGTLDTSFNSGGIGFQTIAPGTVRAVLAQPDHKTIIAGTFDFVGSEGRYRMARLNEDGSLDAGFVIPTTGANRFTSIRNISHLARQADGKIIVSGTLSYTISGETRHSIARLNTDGSLDPTFNIYAVVQNYEDTAQDAGANKIIVQPDGKILIGNSRNGGAAPPQNSPAPLRISPDGSRDTSFNPAFLSNVSTFFILDIVLQPDGKILIGGRSSTPGTGMELINKSFIARLNADGSVDSSFQVSEQSDRTVRSLQLLPSGKVLVAQSTGQGALMRSEVIRLNTNGSSDSSFNAGSGANGKISVLLAMPDGSILVGGLFSVFGGLPHQNLVLLNENGTASGNLLKADQEVLNLTVDFKNRVLVGGAFRSISAGGTEAARTYLARLTDEAGSDRRALFDFDGDGKSDISVFRPSNGTWYLQQSAKGLTETQFGLGSDKLVPADFDGDGKTDVAVYRNGTWFLQRSAAGFLGIAFGEATDIPMPADFTGDGRAEIAVFRPSNGGWYIYNLVNNQFTSIQFGQAGDIPVAADYDGDGKADVAVFRSGTWYANRSQLGFLAFAFGESTDKPVPADFDGDGRADIAVYRPSNGTWYLQRSQLGFTGFQFGIATDKPVPADYDGDGKVDIAVFREGTWYLQRSRDGFTGMSFGAATDKAVPNAFVP